MSRHTGNVPTRFKSRQHSRENPMSFDYVVDVEVEAPQPTPEAQALRDARWDRFTAWALGLADSPTKTVSSGAACA